MPDHRLWELGWWFSIRCLLFGHRWFRTVGTVAVFKGMDGLENKQTHIDTCTRCGCVHYEHEPAPYFA